MICDLRRRESVVIDRAVGHIAVEMVGKVPSGVNHPDVGRRAVTRLRVGTGSRRVRNLLSVQVERGSNGSAVGSDDMINRAGAQRRRSGDAFPAGPESGLLLTDIKHEADARVVGPSVPENSRLVVNVYVYRTWLDPALCAHGGLRPGGLFRRLAGREADAIRCGAAGE